jgi:hypothetical protein
MTDTNAHPQHMKVVEHFNVLDIDVGAILGESIALTPTL